MAAKANQDTKEQPKDDLKTDEQPGAATPPAGDEAPAAATDEGDKAKESASALGLLVQHMALQCRRRPEARAAAAMEDIEVTAERFALGILSHPRAEAFLGGNPLDNGKYDGMARGEYLAARCFALATDFRAKLENLCKERAAELAELYRIEDEAGSTAEVGAE
ncbi:MAG: hypothetical protein PHE83_18680 [Opitutaceae bacterium]|nr:hypothetical protein [Opitutaceae bacterium]